ncbi:uncharacterized protein F5Z01DRAFT_493234 [Emericellopsis atlantica]|uniref:Uncharacterized protein n=1 Tax=Emericellopsis atlantica TaxID=2614577 RepID=A0A9P8CS71_9HYPO|nr:uncharacterized protein F5Z01DRAFT_493234 [Emericellopsis atlantica]KAG9256920.1 hypothetical protein F5Z01DRAFT_493234 [Emericellopsis atlantica]
MAVCLCSTIHTLAHHPNESRALELAATLDAHLNDIRILLAQSKGLSRKIQYKVTSNIDRTSKALSLKKSTVTPAEGLGQCLQGGMDSFWTVKNQNSGLQDLQRRMACVVIFLESILEHETSIPPHIANILKGQCRYTELRNAGRKYIKIARKLGSLGSILWLPLSIPYSTYERYLQVDDADILRQLESARPPNGEKYTKKIQELIVRELKDTSSPLSYYNLVVDYPQVLPASDLLLLLLHALGGADIPDVIFNRLQKPQKRWNDDGEMEDTSALDFGLPAELLNLASDDENLSPAQSSPDIENKTTKDGVLLFSLTAEAKSRLEDALVPATVEHLGKMAQKLLCYICPPCLEGNLEWSVPLKTLMWPVVERAITTHKVPVSLRSHAAEAVLYFAERDSVPIRQSSVALAKSLLRKSMPYHLHASVVLFQSTLLRIDGEFVKSESIIRDFNWKGPKPVTRRDHGLLGRLHVSLVETKIKLYDKDVASWIYKWEAQQPQSSLDTEVTFRLQSTAARYFQSIGDFPAARESLNQFLSLGSAKPLRSNTRRLLVGRLADVYCEMKEYDKAIDLLQAEMDQTAPPDRSRRWFARLLLAGVEANIGLGRMETAGCMLEELSSTEPKELDDIHDQQLHIRRLVASARMTHVSGTPEEAVACWQALLRRVSDMHTLTSFATAVIHLSLAHAHLLTGDRDSGRRAWATGLEILRQVACEFWLPTVTTLWLQWIAADVYRLQSWSFRMMQPGGKPDVVCCGRRRAPDGGAHDVTTPKFDT